MPFHRLLAPAGAGLCGAGGGGRRAGQRGAPGQLAQAPPGARPAGRPRRPGSPGATPHRTTPGLPGVRPGPQAMEEATMSQSGGTARAATPVRQTEAMTVRVLEATGLVKRYKRTTAVAGVSLAVDAGERVALLGANGAGKTTTLLMLLGAITPAAGS